MAVAVRAHVVANGYITWETGLLDLDSGLFAYQAWKNNVAYARVVGPDQYTEVRS